jgi:2-iminobutanoate/2-iminopropanoate deaminase
VTLQVIHPKNAQPGPLPYSAAIKVGPFVFVSGQASVDPHGVIVPDTFACEMRRAFDNVAAILSAAGLGFSDVVQVRSYLAHQPDWQEYNQIYSELFSPPYPARTTLFGCLGLSLKFEVDVIAYCVD